MRIYKEVLDGQQMTVGDLKIFLADVDDNRLVWTEGHDLISPAGGIEIDDEGRIVVNKLNEEIT